MKVRIDWDEKYPVFFVRETRDGDYPGDVYDVPPEVVERWQRVAGEYAEMQAELRALNGWVD